MWLSVAESIQVILQAWEKHKEAADEVCFIGNAEDALFFKVVEEHHSRCMLQLPTDLSTADWSWKIFMKKKFELCKFFYPQ